MLKIGPYELDSPVLLAPMAGVTDLPFRKLCRQFGAGLTTSEMLTSDTKLWHSRKSASRLVVEPQDWPVSMQIAGSEPSELAEAAQACVELGAQIIDINMGCPAKKVCKKAAGSALLGDEKQVERILRAVVEAVEVPVTLKTRTGIAPEQKNGPRVAKLAEDIGVSAVAIHGRTRACRFNGEAEYKTIKNIAAELDIPVLANGDINSAAKAAAVKHNTGAAAVLIGRAALGQPWLFREMKHFLVTGALPAPLNLKQKKQVIEQHLNDLHAFYGPVQGTRIARKHFGWYCQYLANGEHWRKQFNQLQEAEQQLELTDKYFQWLFSYEEEAA
ncbi:tRNA dihydrouridine synthase DusB [Agaribacterium haliotis]|uniref:tRNA dihydrouridine synthase DusB n=1 Tax=Agaribacterium haliotis TaxID=2013869 RepID=UPI000BB53A09|nr:tRNA dihydrouridine synthase DusB [Agaribacterium haliotis]